MLVYGTKSTLILADQTNEKCSSCGHENCVQMYIHQKYFHIFWIPLFPYKKTAITQCTHCKKALEKKEFSSNLNFYYEKLVTKAKTPIWTFSGLAILAGLITWGTIVGKQNEAKHLEHIEHPLVNDLYKIKTETNQYTVYKVSKVSKDSVYYFVNQFETNKYSGLSDIISKGDASYIPVPVGVSIGELKTKLESGEILGIERAE
ncbi:MAG: zinc-ribbon domain-containing protein [Cytophagales bacterium]